MIKQLYTLESGVFKYARNDCTRRGLFETALWLGCKSKQSHPIQPRGTSPKRFQRDEFAQTMDSITNILGVLLHEKATRR